MKQEHYFKIGNNENENMWFDLWVGHKSLVHMLDLEMLLWVNLNNQVKNIISIRSLKYGTQHA